MTMLVVEDETFTNEGIIDEGTIGDTIIDVSTIDVSISGALAIEAADDNQWLWYYEGRDGSALKGKVTGGALTSAASAIVACTRRLKMPTGTGVHLDVSWTVRKNVELVRAGVGQRKGVHARVAELEELIKSGVVVLSVADETLATESSKAGQTAAWARWKGVLEAPEVRLEGESVVIATDGSYNHQIGAGIGTWCWYHSPESYAVGILENTTSTQCELLAIQRALEATQEGASVQILTDCKGLVTALRRKRETCKDPTESAMRGEVRALMATRRVTLTWVRGHNGHRKNRQADHRARGALRAYVGQMATT